MKFLVSLPHISKGHYGRVGEFEFSHEFQKHLLTGKPLEVDPFDELSVDRFNVAIDMAIRRCFQAIRYPPRIEMLPVTAEELAEDAVAEPSEIAAAEAEPAKAPELPAKKRNVGGRPTAVAFPIQPEPVEVR